MKTASIVLLLVYSALMFATLFVKNEKLKWTKLLVVLGIAAAIAHTVLYFVEQTHWALLLASLSLFMAYAIANGLLTKKPHPLHWLARLVFSTLVLVLFIL